MAIWIFFHTSPTLGSEHPFQPSAFPKGYQEDVISLQIQIASIYSLLHAEVNSPDTPNCMTKTSGCPPGPLATVPGLPGVVIPARPHLLGRDQAARKSSCGAACGQQVEACLHRCCLFPYCRLPGGCLQHSTTPCLPVTLSPALPMALPVPLTTSCSKRQRPSLGG